MIIFACIKNHLHIRWLLERELFKIINLIEYVIIVHRQNSHKWKSSDKSRRLNWPTEMNKKTNKIILTRAYNSHHFSLSLSDGSLNQGIEIQSIIEPRWITYPPGTTTAAAPALNNNKNKLIEKRKKKFAADVRVK